MFFIFITKIIILLIIITVIFFEGKWVFLILEFVAVEVGHAMHLTVVYCGGCVRIKAIQK